MPSYIIKLHDEKLNRDWYLEWSTIVDSPVTSGMTREEFREHYRRKYGYDAMRDEFEHRMGRVDLRGTSSMLHQSAEQTIHFNRAGEGETNIDLEAILERYCRNQPAESTPCPSLNPPAA